ncbi:MAG TPA: competence/damage-inducible protein A [Candidatus Binatia bacterium]|jgi:nicotinamide-nucleotide amidase|nr:competence/damage-inducible protein A [Candidatus Binatia bacterium]
MTIELLNTGTELMLGRVLNTHQQWLCRQLADLGYLVARQVAVADTGGEIEAAVREALARADLVITTGGLGPTSDDLTRDLLARLLGRSLREDPTVLAHIKHFFEMRNRLMPERTRVQAMVPEGALVLPNPHGTAPGLTLEIRPNQFRPRASWLIMLPGPPRELRPMFIDSVVPLLRRVLPPETGFVCRTLRATGIGESLVEEKVGPPLQRLVQTGLELGYCARPGQVDVRLAARGSHAQSQVEEAEGIVRTQLGQHLFGMEDEELEEITVRRLTERKETLAVAESCTGGCIAHRLTNVPGASAVLLAGLVTYSDQAKQKFLGVHAETLAQHGAVSEPVARQMAEGARRETGADYALSVTGIAGPSGGTTAKPIGTVFIGLAGSFETIVERNFNPWDRETFKQVTAQQALELLRRQLGGGV